MTMAILKLTDEPKGSGELKIRTSKQLAVITVKSEQFDFTIGDKYQIRLTGSIRYCIHMM